MTAVIDRRSAPVLRARSMRVGGRKDSSFADGRKRHRPSAVMLSMSMVNGPLMITPVFGS